MLASDRMILFAISMSLVLAMALIFLIYREVERRRIRRGLSASADEAMELLCDDNYFNLGKLLDSFRISQRTYNVVNGDALYGATIGGKKQFRFTMRMTNGHYVLEKIEHYQGVNWQFADWYNIYERQNDASPARYIVTGEIADRATKKHRLPGFSLTRTAIEQLVTECINACRV